jgi:hypothetical protein
VASQVHWLAAGTVLYVDERFRNCAESSGNCGKLFRAALADSAGLQNQKLESQQFNRFGL